MRRIDKRKKGSRVVIIISFLLLACLGFFIYQNIHEQRLKKNGEETLKEYINLLSTGKYDESLDYLSQESLKSGQLSKEQVKEKYQNIFGGLGIHDIKIKNLRVKEKTFNYTLILQTSLGRPLE